MLGKEAIEGEYKQLLEDRKQRVLETVANMLVHVVSNDLPIDVQYMDTFKERFLQILQDNFHSYEIRNKP